MDGERATTDSLEWEWTPMGEGGRRWAFPARVKEGHSLAGFQSDTELVLKIVKPRAYRQGVRITEEDVRVQELANALADSFNKLKLMRGGKLCAVHFIVGRCLTASKTLKWKGKRKVAEGDSVLVEQRIVGTYEKFNSNSGWSSGEGFFPDAFSHWTWVQSEGEQLVCDLQGHHRGVGGGPKWGEEDSYYLFTDPAILSKTTGRYGCTDLGASGQVQWFKNHHCNTFCHKLGIKGKQPSFGHVADDAAKCLRTTTFRSEAPGPVFERVHFDATCDECSMHPIVGDRYVSYEKNYELCQGCFDKSKDWDKFQRYLRAPRFAVYTNVTCDGCGSRPIYGVLFFHRNKADYDLCRGCFLSKGEKFEMYHLGTIHVDGDDNFMW